MISNNKTTCYSHIVSNRSVYPYRTINNDCLANKCFKIFSIETFIEFFPCRFQMETACSELQTLNSKEKEKIVVSRRISIVKYLMGFVVRAFLQFKSYRNKIVPHRSHEVSFCMHIKDMYLLIFRSFLMSLYRFYFCHKNVSFSF